MTLLLRKIQLLLTVAALGVLFGSSRPARTDGANGTRDVSHVSHRRPHPSATKAVVPEPQVGSRTKSPGRVVIKMQRSMTFGEV